MTGRIELVHNFTGQPNYVIIRWFKTTAPNTPASGFVNGGTVTQVVYPAPHGQESLLIEQLDPVMYLVKAYSSTDGVNPDGQINELACDAAIAARYVLDVITYVVGRGTTGDPADGDTGLRDSRLAGKKYLIYERGTGPMVPADDISAEVIDRTDDGGGWDWVDPDKVFNEGAIYIVSINNTVDVMPDTGGGGGGSALTDILTFNSDATYDIGTHANKVLYAGGSGTVRTLTLAALSGVGDSEFEAFYGGGGLNYFVIKLNAGDTVMWQGSAVNRICMAKGQGVKIVIRNNVAYAIRPVGEFNLRGLPFGSYEQVPNGAYVRADGSIAKQAAVNWPGIWDYLQLIPASSRVSVASWEGNVNLQAKWGVDLFLQEFYFPKLTNLHSRFVNADAAGDYLADGVGPHGHPLRSGRGGGIDGNVNGGAALYNNVNTTIWPANSPSNISVQNNTGTTETTVKSFKQYPIIHL